MLWILLILLFLVLVFMFVYLLFSIHKKTVVSTSILTSQPPRIINSKLYEIIRMIQPVHPIISTLEFTEDNESYTLNKKKIHLCLRDEYGRYYDNNMLVYAALHEVAHALSPDIAHNEKSHNSPYFLNNYKELLQRAEYMGIYDSRIRPVPHYCSNKK